MKLPEPSNGGDFTPTPMGRHLAVLTRLIDLGTQPGSQTFPDPKHKILLGWEIPSERVKYTKDGEEHEGPVVHFERMTFSMHEKAILRQRLESWRGKPFTDEDFGSFDMQNLLRVGAEIQISHDHKDGKTYANMQAIMLPRSKEEWPEPEGDVIYLSLADGEFDQATYDGLSEGLRNTIAKSPEYQRATGIVNQGYGAGGAPSNHELDDEIPFAPVKLI